MIYVNVELWRHGNSERKLKLFEAIIRNRGDSGYSSLGNYEWIISRRGGFRADPKTLASFDVKNVLRRGTMDGFPRLRLGAADLLFRCLRLGFGERNK